MGEERKVYKFSVGKFEGKRPLGRPSRRWEDRIGMGLGKWAGVVDWIQLSQGMNRWRACVNALMNLLVVAATELLCLSTLPQ
jgi:hypothetical protein